MGRRSKLTDEQWRDVEQRAHAGEPVLHLAREYGINEKAIRQRMAKIDAPTIKAAAQSIAAARVQIDKTYQALPEIMRGRVSTLADKLVSISESISLSAELAAKTSARLSHIANQHAFKIDENEPDGEILRMVHALTETANKAAYQPMQLIAANKDLAKSNSDVQMPTQIVIGAPPANA